jgi:hypothetical protein
MSTIRINWTDRATNETRFNIYRGTEQALSIFDDLIVRLELINGTWNIENRHPQTISNLSIVQSGSTDITDTGTDFVISFEDASSGEFWYGVSAANPVGDSDIVPVPNKITI